MDNKTTTYAVICFSNLQSRATYHKEGLTKIGSARVFKKRVQSGAYQCVVLREETVYHDCHVETSIVIKTWNAKQADKLKG